MNSSASLRSDSTRGRSRAGIADPLSLAKRYAWRTRAVRQNAELRRTLQAARTRTNGLVGSASVAAGLEEDTVEQLLMTRRFMEREDDEARRVMRLATVRDVRTTVVDGVAALELDLFNDGIAARLRAAF